MTMDPEIEASDLLRHEEDQYLINEDYDMGLGNEAAQLPPLIPSTYSNTWPSNCSSEHQISLNLPAVDQNQIPHSNIQNHASPSTYPPSLSNVAMHQNQIPDSAPQDHTSPSTYPPSLSNAIMHHQSEVVTKTPIQVASLAQEYFNHQNELVNQSQIPHSMTPHHHTMPSRSSLPMPSMNQFDPQSLSNVPIMHQPLPTTQFYSQIPYNFPVNQSPLMVELSPQDHSGFPVQMPLPINQFNLQNIAQATPSMSTYHMSPALTSFDPFHAHSAPQNHIVYSISPIHQYSPQNPSNGDHYNQQPHHELLPLTSSEFSSNLWLFNRQHLVNQPSISSEEPININPNINKGKLWTEEEHRLFLIGVQIYGKGDWKNISRNVVKTRTPTQIASHAQKFFDRQLNNVHKERSRKSIHDITDPYDFPERHHQN